MKPDLERLAMIRGMADNPAFRISSRETILWLCEWAELGMKA